MGTSGIYAGPKDKNPLLPDWIDDIGANSDDQKSPKTRKGSWQNAKTQMSHYISGSNRNMGSVFRSYVRAHGGAKYAAQSAINGRATTINLGNVLSSISTIGFKQTLSDYGVEYEGRTLVSVLNDLANKIAPTGALKEDDVARKAVLDSLEYFYTELDHATNSLDDLNEVNDNLINDVMEKYISSYIFERMLNDLASRIELYGNDARSIEDDIQAYIEGSVKNKLADIRLDKIDYNSSEINHFVVSLFEECYEVLEGSI